jgi:serine protease Do
MKKFCKSFLIGSFSILFFSILAGMAWGLTETAQKIYKRHSASVYQIQIIDINSGEKSVIGSGFSFSKKGLFATNYHVISDVVDTPERYRIEYHKGSEKQGELSLLALDVAHDLAILKGRSSKGPVLALGSSNRLKGDRVYPIGNPLDLGMTIIEGTFNGLVGVDPYQHILLSAPLNPGMSGGPAFSSSGKVIGVNVAIEGNDLSYLVPVEYLVKLVKEGIKKQKAKEWRGIIQDQILERHTHLIGQIAKADLSLEKFGSLRVPESLLPSGVKCWGNSEPEKIKEKQFYSFGQKWCQSQGDIYLSRSLFTGSFGYLFVWMESESLNATEFYKKYANKFSASRFYPYATEQEVVEFRCENDFVKLAERNWKVAYCVRQYKKYPKLHDVVVSLAVLGDPKRGHAINIGLAGINEKLARLFLNKLLGGIQWID